MKRGHGEGTVTRLPSGNYRVRVPTATGRVGGTYATEAEAENVRIALVDKLRGTIHAATGSTTFGAWGWMWIRERQREGLRCARTEESIWRNRVEPHLISRVSLVAITREHVRGWLADQKNSTAQFKSKGHRVKDLGRPLGVGTLSRYRAVIHGCLQTAFERELIRTNPATGHKLIGIERGKQQGPKWTYLTRHEIARVLTCDLIPVRFRLLYQVAIYTGLRRGELWGLRWGDVTLDGDRPEIHVQRSHDDTPKNGRDRLVPLLPPARAALQRLHQLAKSTAPEALVFPTAKGKMRARGDRGQWGKNGPMPGYCTVAGITRRVPFHAFRHTCATALISGWWGAAWRLEDVQRILGHQSIKVTARYAHLSPDYLHTLAARTAQDTPPDVSQAAEISGHGTTENRDENAADSTTECSSTMSALPIQLIDTTRQIAPRGPGVSGSRCVHAPEAALRVSQALAEGLLRAAVEGIAVDAAILALVSSAIEIRDERIDELILRVNAEPALRLPRAIALADAVITMARTSVAGRAEGSR